MQKTSIGTPQMAQNADLRGPLGLIQDLRQSGKGLARRLEPAPHLIPGVRVIHGALTMPYPTIERPWNYDTQLDTPKWPMLTFVALHPRPAMLRA